MKQILQQYKQTGSKQQTYDYRIFIILEWLAKYIDCGRFPFCLLRPSCLLDLRAMLTESLDVISSTSMVDMPDYSVYSSVQNFKLLCMQIPLFKSQTFNFKQEYFGSLVVRGAEQTMSFTVGQKARTYVIISCILAVYIISHINCALNIIITCQRQMVIFCYRRAAYEMRNSEIITEAAGRGYKFKIIISRLATSEQVMNIYMR